MNTGRETGVEDDQIPRDVMGEVSPKGSQSPVGSGQDSAGRQQPLPPPKSKEEWDDFITR